MPISAEEVSRSLSAAAKDSPAWQAAGATVRFVVSDPEVELTLDPQGAVTDAAPTHVVRIRYRDLQDLAAGRRTFLRTVTSRRISSHGPVMQTFGFGQALTTFAL
ncbi:hypothetical protein ACH4NS_00875 [Streptomyces mutabilis]|jgi:hypothetical protein|uniref:hypothetical protein n=1 Tax=Streptomyces TaxID=1883 RepID=UPI000A2429FB|nr:MULTISPECIES: hypothetical protein [Streptomyces]MDG9690482.1 hypothetical protein [Streptomyces sp. DH17]OSC73272.1 hypothetical protein B5181_00870 [Streptomyces sp. 4F]MCZ9349769.1 hypothetical protein [Streptomyces mutabilis]MDN3246404.1 hypothetical protein [Streptomyces sp. ZSW22]MDN3251253.1 hypothetical protein [Streptomyces sp. MA25(2023)]